jgi:hypothetical protein
MTSRIFLALACVLVILRLPSLVQPMGGDQGLYAYVGERILAGELPYVDAWDQKPPAVHVTYAVLRAIWPHDSVVAAADLIAAMTVAWMLVALGGVLVRPVTGQVAALLFLFLSNPAFARLGGVAVRAQAETFIAVVVTGAFLLLLRPGASAWRLAAAGVLFGLAITFKYNMAVYALAGAVMLALAPRRPETSPAGALVSMGLGALIPVAALLVFFASRGALTDLYQATITYNVEYSGETYAGPLDALGYLLTFPVQHARVDALWLVGGAGSAVLTAAAPWGRDRLIAPVWVGAACVAIAINSSRGLPQYFVQAGPALALAAAWAGTLLWSRRSLVNLAALALVGYGVWRVNNFQKLVENTRHDARYVMGAMSREDHLARYGEPNVRKYSAIAVERLADYLRAHTAQADPVLVFGFSPGAYVKADRVSASRFFWSRPVIAGFNEGVEGYGASGLLADLERRPPALIALQQVDWLNDVDNSAQYFTSHPLLGVWLRTRYTPADGPEGFDIWQRREPHR